MIPDLDRICPECGAPDLTLVTTTASKWLGHCPACGAQVWQFLPFDYEPSPKEPDHTADSPPTHHRTNPRSAPNPTAARPARANKNLPLGARFAPRTRHPRERRRFPSQAAPRFRRADALYYVIALAWVALLLALFALFGPNDNPDAGWLPNPTPEFTEPYGPFRQCQDAWDGTTKCIVW